MSPWRVASDVYEALVETIAAHSASLGSLKEAVDEHGEALKAHQKQLDDLTDSLTAAPDGPWAWAVLRGAERENLWKRLFEWVTWLEDRYLRNLSPSRPGIPALHADWYRHPVAVELMTSLMVAHIAAYRKKATAPSFLLVDWHERALWPTLRRMDELGLFGTEHKENDWNGPELRPTRRDPDRFNRWMAADVAEHSERVEDASEEASVDP